LEQTSRDWYSSLIQGGCRMRASSGKLMHMMALSSHSGALCVDTQKQIIFAKQSRGCDTVAVPYQVLECLEFNFL
jgi:hypothetical protein